MSEKVNIPQCYATFEVGHPQCEGDPKGKSADDRASCAFRDRCRGLQLYVIDQAGCVDDDSIEEVLGSMDTEEFLGTADMIVERRDIVDGRLPSERPSSRKTQTKKRRRRATRSSPYPERLMVLHAHGQTCIRDRFSDWRFAEKGRIIAGAGVIYEANRIATCDYSTVYCSAEEGQPTALLSFRFRPGTVVIDLELPVTVATLQSGIPKKAFAALDVRPLDRGQFRSVVKGVDQETTIGLIIETLRKFVTKQVISISMPS